MAAGRSNVGLWLRSAFFTVLLPGTVVLWVPLALIAAEDGDLGLGEWRWLGLPFVGGGAAGLGSCIVDFARHGRGTLAPVDPPRFVVRGGLYRYVRNPMYVAVLATLVGETLLFSSAWMLAWTAFVAVIVNLFVIGYEEPTLRRMFGDDYEAYARATPRWIPRRPSAVARRDQSADGPGAG